MNDPLFIENEIEINAPKEKVWQALTDPTVTKKYMFGCEVISSFKEGDSMVWEGDVEGERIMFVKGNIVKCDINHELVYTAFDPTSGAEDIPDNYLTITYRLTESAGKTTLFVSQGDFAKVHDGEVRYQSSMDNGGWIGLLMSVKQLLEEGE